MSAVDPRPRRGKIIQNLELLRKEIAAQPDPAVRSRLQLMVVGKVLPLGAIGLDERHWWRGANRYSTNPADHTTFNAAWLAAATARRPGRALDLGAGEGSDAIRVARLGYAVDAIEVSAVACEKSDSPVPRACASPCGASRSRPPGCRHV